MKKVMKHVLHAIANILPDVLYLLFIYRRFIGVFPHLWNPKTFNEKMQWLKLYDRKPEYTTMVDKYAARAYIAEKIGGQYLVPLVGGPWNNFDEIDFAKLSEQFVLKCTHDCGSVILCHNKETFDLKSAEIKLSKALKRTLYYHGREWPYKNVPPRIIAEKLLGNEQVELYDYKLWCFNGVPKCWQVPTNRFSQNGLCLTFFNMQWQQMPFTKEYPASEQEIPRPHHFDTICALSKILSHGHPFLRVDWYECEQKLYIGELTFYPTAGLGKFQPAVWDEILGGWLKLPDNRT